MKSPVFTKGRHRILQVATAIGACFFVMLMGLRAVRPPLAAIGSFSKAVYDHQGNLLRLTLNTEDKYRLWTPLKQIAPELIEATLLFEDRYFYLHPSINPVALVRGLFRSIFGTGPRTGGSTLSMQLARKIFQIDSKTAMGKFHQIFRAMQLELMYSKNDILEGYLNFAPYGGNIEGVGAASLVFFHKEAAKLSLAESFSLAVIPQKPRARTPTSRVRRESDQQTQNVIMNLFAKWKQVHPEYNKEARYSDEFKFKVRTYLPSELPFLAPHLVELMLRHELSDPKIQTTLDLALQKSLERQMKDYLFTRKNLGLKNGAALLVNHETMEVKAMVGSNNYFSAAIQGQVNGVQAKRSPGSTLKPLLYALAIDQGLIHQMTMLKDTPMSFGSFDPENFDRDFLGPVTAEDALIRSRNLPAVYLASKLKAPSLYDFIKTAGVTQLKDEKYYGLSIALGGAEVTMEDLTRFYAMLANGGRLKPLRYRRVDEQITGQHLISPEASSVVLEMLKNNPRPSQEFRSAWTRDQVAVHWKTGTSHGYRDAWSVAVFGNYVLAVWIGNFDGESNHNLIGRDAAAPLLFRMIDGIRIADKSFRPWLQVNGTNLTKVKVCAVSGEQPGPHCKHTKQSLFIPGKSPIATCQIHRLVKLNIKTGRRVCAETNQPTRTEVFEFWPSDMMKLFSQAGMPRRRPPPYEPGCSIEHRQALGLQPKIMSPKQDLVYVLRSLKNGSETIPLVAAADADASELFWFSDGDFIGKTATAKTLLWSPRPGRHLVRVVDEQGRSDKIEIQVSFVD